MRKGIKQRRLRNVPQIANSSSIGQSRNLMSPRCRWLITASHERKKYQTAAIATKTQKPMKSPHRSRHLYLWRSSSNDSDVTLSKGGAGKIRPRKRKAVRIVPGETPIIIPNRPSTQRVIIVDNANEIRGVHQRLRHKIVVVIRVGCPFNSPHSSAATPRWLGGRLRLF